ncbi:MAG TPA: DUF1906 domain-containing protein [Pseudonocardiaceae bacterium]
MLEFRRARKARPAVVACAVAVALAAGSGVALAAPGPQAGDQQVSYLGLDFTVPSSWPVITVSATSTTCVRFDRHAVYLGTPGRDQNCPTHLVGRTEALLVQPATATTASATENTEAHQISVTNSTVSITATYDRDRAAVSTALASAGLPAPSPQATRKPQALTPSAAALPTSATNDTGAGFDACTAPATGTMNAWRSGSPYSAIGIYIGGQDVACSQANLTAAWTSAQSVAGWHFLPLYVGPQAAFNQITAPQSQGTSAADDAVARASALGFGPGNVLYYDMEAYPPGQRGPALAFEAAWTTELHRAGYWSSVYSSADSGITDLVANYGGLTTPDVAFTARWDGVATTDDTVIPAADFAGHQRVHQYQGGHNETYDNVTINIDSDQLDVGVAGTPAVPVTSGFVPTSPTRVLDTRNGTGAPQAKLGGGATLALPVFGGTANVPIDTTAVVLNVTATNPTVASFLTVFPDGGNVPGASNLNFTPGETIPNLVVVPVTDGSVDFINLTGSVDVVADLFGYYTPSGGEGLNAVPPTRILDTRNGTGAPQAKLQANQTLVLTVLGSPAGIPSTASGVILNVTVTNPSESGFLSVFPFGQPVPNTSNLNFTAGETIPNLVMVPINSGNVTIYNRSGSVDVIADVFGYYANGVRDFTPVAPTRLLDTRNGTGAPVAKVQPNQTLNLRVANLAGVPSTVSSIVLNVTVTNPTAASFLSAFPGGEAVLPTVSNLNFTAGETIPNLVIVPVTNGSVNLYNKSGTVDVIADVFGYF